MSSNNLSILDIQAKDNLVRIWKDKQKERGFTQESAAAEIAAKAGDKTNQATLGHYLNGRRRLTVKATLMFSSFLKVPPEEIAPDLDYGYLHSISQLQEKYNQSKDQARYQYEQSFGEFGIKDSREFLNSSPKAQEIATAILKLSSSGDIDDSKCDAIGVLIGLGGGKASGLIKKSKGKT